MHKPEITVLTSYCCWRIECVRLIRAVIINGKKTPVAEMSCAGQRVKEMRLEGGCVTWNLERLGETLDF